MFDPKRTKQNTDYVSFRRIHPSQHTLSGQLPATYTLIIYARAHAREEADFFRPVRTIMQEPGYESGKCRNRGSVSFAGERPGYATILPSIGKRLSMLGKVLPCPCQNCAKGMAETPHGLPEVPDTEKGRKVSVFYLFFYTFARGKKVF